MSENSPKIGNSDLDNIFALSYILNILNYDNFISFLSKKGLNDEENTFNGFTFFVKSVSYSLLNTICRSWSLNLEEDFTFSRANFTGISIFKIKNTCQKTIFVKNLYNLLEKLWTASNKKEYNENRYDVERIFLSKIENIFDNNVSLTKDYNNIKKKELIRRLAIFWNYIYFNDTGRGYPHGYFFSLSPSEFNFPFKLNLSESKKVFLGYKFTLVFVWKELLKDKEETEFLKKIEKAKNWQEIDAFFGLIREKIIFPLEKEFPLSHGNYFNLKKPILPTTFNEYFFHKPPEPELSGVEDLNQTLFWYPVQALWGGYVFSGAAAFASTLVGTIMLKKSYGIEDKVKVIRFIHFEQVGNSYSYGVLIEVFGIISDYSGWVVSFDCGTDYSGFGGSEYQFIEEIINLHKDSIEVIEYKIESELLLNYLKSFSIKLPLKENIEKVLRFEHILILYEKLLTNRDLGEEDIQKFLAKNSMLLDPTSKEIIPKQRLGAEFICDFVIKSHDSKYTLVEIEKPSYKLYTKNGDQTKELRHAIRQVEDWQRWIEDNISYARTLLPNISSPKGLVIIGRCDTLTEEDTRRLSHSNTVTRRDYEIITYDELLDRGKSLLKNIKSRPI